MYTDSMNVILIILTARNAICKYSVAHNVTKIDFFRVHTICMYEFVQPETYFILKTWNSVYAHIKPDFIHIFLLCLHFYLNTNSQLYILFKRAHTHTYTHLYTYIYTQNFALHTQCNICD